MSANNNPSSSQVTPAVVAQPSSLYSTTRRHSLYGIEDKVVIDPGSRIWKAGFSGEGRPRDVFYAENKDGRPLWALGRASDPSERAEEDRLLQVKLERCLRKVFHDSLLTDPKARKVILFETPLLPLHIKQILARILFENLQVISISFACSHLLALLASGRITGFVLDCGHMESTALPIFASRPLFPQLRTTPLAGSRLTHHLRALLLLFGTYIPPPASLSTAANVPASTRSTRVPQDILTDVVVEEIKTRCCFVGESLADPASFDVLVTSSPADAMDVDRQQSAPRSESNFSRVSGREGGSSAVSSQMDLSESSPAAQSPRVVSGSTVQGQQGGEAHLEALATLYKRHSTATDIHMRIDPPASQQTGTGRGTLIIPGWIRERAAEVLFEGGDVDESSVAEVILDALLKVPVDLRKTMASSILVVGGTPMLPGFIPRLQTELVRAISPPASSNRQRPPYDRYAVLRPLTAYIAILNDPSPKVAASEVARKNAGSAPAFAPATMAWVGGSLAGALKTGGVEITREKWDGANQNRDTTDDEDDEDVDGANVSSDGGKMDLVSDPRSVLPDWTRSPMPMGAAASARAAVRA